MDFTPFSEIDSCECNNSFNSACQIGICDTVIAVIAPWFDDDIVIVDDDIYRIELSSSEEVSIEISAVSSNIDICCTIFDSSQSQVESFSGNIGQALNFTYMAQADGAFYFEVTDCNGNFDSESQYELTIGCDLISSIKDLDLLEIANVFPNPFLDHFNIEFENQAEQEFEIILYDVLGNSVFNQKSFTEDNLLINTEHLSKGIYILRLRMGNIHYSTKLLKN